MKTTEKDILMICKGYYDKEKHKSLEDALDAYYRREYDVSKESLPTLSYEFMFSLWFKYCIREFLIPEKIGEFYHNMIAEESLPEKNYFGVNCFNKEPAKDFYEVMFHRCVKWLQLMKVRDKDGNWVVDLSDYAEHDAIDMFTCQHVCFIEGKWYE